MKWCFATNESSVNNGADYWVELIEHAVKSCLQNTSLTPCLIYDGQENDFIRNLQNRGVQIIYHRVSIYDDLRHHCEAKFPGSDGHLQVASSAFLRIDLPELLREDEYVLYTDCDVVFLRDPVPLFQGTSSIACAPQMFRGNRDDLNSGVMWMNVRSLRHDLPDFRRIIRDTIQTYSGWDQEAYRLVYKNRYSLLNDEWNWKPYWGRNDEAVLIHFHGPKPQIARSILETDGFQTFEIYHQLVSQDVESYRYYVDLWSSFGS